MCSFCHIKSIGLFLSIERLEICGTFNAPDWPCDCKFKKKKKLAKTLIFVDSKVSFEYAQQIWFGNIKVV